MLTLEILGQKKSILRVPNGVLKMLGWMGSNLKIPMPFNPAIVPYATKYWFMNNSRAKRELGIDFVPPVQC